MTSAYQSPGPTREELDTQTGALLLEFGHGSCSLCSAAAPLIEEALSVDEATAGAERIRHLKVEDGPGRPLGRSFGVRLWPTLIFLKDGAEGARVVRPTDTTPILDGLRTIRG
jgi:thioredoxin 1